MHLKLNLIRLSILIFFLLSKLHSLADIKDADIFLKVACPEKAYVDQTVAYSLYLYSNYDEIGGINIINMPDFNNFHPIQGQPSMHGEKVKVKGKDYTRWNVGLYFLIPSIAGNFSITGGSYIISVGTPTVVNDFFWGPTRKMQYENVRLEAPDIKIKVHNLGTPPENFSEAIGEFDVECSIPPGEIHENVAAIAIFTVFGEGNLKDAVLPDFDKYFGPSARIRDIKRSDDTVQRDGKIISEIVVECSFIPLKEKGEIRAIPFTYFDVKTGKYKTIYTEVQNWECGGSNRIKPDSQSPTYSI